MDRENIWDMSAGWDKSHTLYLIEDVPPEARRSLTALLDQPSKGMLNDHRYLDEYSDEYLDTEDRFSGEIDGVKYDKWDDDGQYLLPGIIPCFDDQEITFFDDRRYKKEWGSDVSFKRIPFIGSVDPQEIRFREVIKQRSKYEQGSADWLENIWEEVAKELEAEENAGAERNQRVKELEDELRRAQQDAAIAWRAAELAQEQGRQIPDPKPSAMGKAIAFGLGAYAGSKLAKDAGRRREAERIARDIDYYSKRASDARNDFDRRFARQKVEALKAKLLALQV